MLLVGLSWLVAWLCVQVFSLAVDKAMLVTAIIFIIVALVIERPWPVVRK